MVNLSKLKIALAQALPFGSKTSRFLKAFYFAARPNKGTYSQHREDVFVLDVLQKKFPGEKYNYIDVGGFHPALLSNTYLMYRKKMKGVVVEPNKELARLHKIFRPHDIQLEVACSRENKLGAFYVQNTFPALSSLQKEESTKNTVCKYVPVLTLDTIYKSLDFSFIHFLSIDVEGFDYDVLQGAELTLRNTFLVCIECNSKELESQVEQLLSERKFSLLKRFSCNLIFINETFNVVSPIDSGDSK